MNYRFLTKNDKIGLVGTNQDLTVESGWVCNNENKRSFTGRGLSKIRNSPDGRRTRARGCWEDLEIAHPLTILLPTHLGTRY